MLLYETTEVLFTLYTNKNFKALKGCCLCLYSWKGFKEISLLLCTTTMGGSSYNNIKWIYRGESRASHRNRNNDKKVLCSKSVNTVSLVESILLELGRLPVNVLGDGNCFFRAVSCQLFYTPENFYPSNSLFRSKRHIVIFWLFKYKT